MKVSGPDQHFIVDEDALPVREDTAVLVNTWEQHRYVHEPHEQRTVFLALYIEPGWLAGADRSFQRCSHPGFFSRPGVAISHEIRRLREQLVECVGAEASEDPKAAEAIIFDLAAAIARRFADRGSLPAAAGTPNDFRIRRAIRFMHEDNRSAIDLDEVAGVAGLSRPHFNMLFRQCTGASPGVYGNAIRVEAAVRALSEQRQSIESLSDSLGFSAHSNFTRFFQQHTGIAPRQFRRALARGEPRLA